ncbi:MAG: hypothetical protein Q7T11_02500 [Deltaproteobacteria bacterium]|nr:hypothetical protein [Deltaproteobacteria bacterium]
MAGELSNNTQNQQVLIGIQDDELLISRPVEDGDFYNESIEDEQRYEPVIVENSRPKNTTAPTVYKKVGPTLTSVEQLRPAPVISASGVWNSPSQYTDQILAAAEARESSPDNPLNAEQEDLAVQLMDQGKWARDIVLAATELYSSPDRPLTIAQERLAVAVAETASRSLSQAAPQVQEVVVAYESQDSHSDNCPFCNDHNESSEPDAVLSETGVAADAANAPASDPAVVAEAQPAVEETPVEQTLSPEAAPAAPAVAVAEQTDEANATPSAERPSSSNSPVAVENRSSDYQRSSSEPITYSRDTGEMHSGNPAVAVRMGSAGPIREESDHIIVRAQGNTTSFPSSTGDQTFAPLRIKDGRPQAYNPTLVAQRAGTNSSDSTGTVLLDARAGNEIEGTEIGAGTAGEFQQAAPVSADKLSQGAVAQAAAFASIERDNRDNTRDAVSSQAAAAAQVGSRNQSTTTDDGDLRMAVGQMDNPLNDVPASGDKGFGDDQGRNRTIEELYARVGLNDEAAVPEEFADIPEATIAELVERLNREPVAVNV